MAARLAVAMTLVTGLVACMPVAAPIEGGSVGPQLAVRVTNTSDREVEVGYEFDAGNSSGGGTGSVAACQQMMVPFGTVSGRYNVMLDGEVLVEGTVPSGVSSDAWLVVDVGLDAAGAPELTGTRVAGEMPGPDPRPIPGCS